MKRSASVVLSILFVACAGRDGIPDRETTTRDSAGTRITVNRASLDSSTFEVSKSPLLTIETDPEDSLAVIHWIRGGARLSDKRIALVSESSKRILLFDSTGSLLRSVGREGDGPGEFRAPFQLTVLPGDTLVVSERDWSFRRSWFAPDGRFVRSVSLDREAAADSIATDFTLGERLFVPPDQTLWRVIKRYDPATAPIGERYRKPETFLLQGPEDGSIKRLDWFQSWEYFRESERVGRWAFFAPRTVATSGGEPNRIVVGDGASFDIHVYDQTGSLIQLIRDEIPPTPISPRDIEWERWEVLDWAKQSGQLPEWMSFADAMPIPDRKPAFEDMAVDRQGCLWVKEYGSYKPDPVRYRVYDTMGTRVGAVSLPGRLRVLDIGSDYVLGLNGDVEYIETVRLYGLDRKGSSC
jgi:hypothetical protein